MLSSLGAYQSLAQLEQDYHRHIADVSKRLNSLEEEIRTHPSRIYLRSERWRSTESIWLAGSSQSLRARFPKQGEIVQWKFSSYSFPIGLLTIRRISRSIDPHSDASNKDSRSWSTELEFTYLPPQWIAHTIVKALLKLESFNGRTP